MRLFDRGLNRIKENLLKEHNCIPFNTLFPKFSEYVPGIMQKNYYIVTANSKHGKTQITDTMFLYHPYNFVTNTDTDITIKIFYFSLEMDLESKIVQGISKLLYERHNIVLEPRQLLKYKGAGISSEVIKHIENLKDYFYALDDVLVISDHHQNPTGIWKQMWKYAEDNGKLLYKTVITKDPDTGEEKSIPIFDRYVPNKPNEHVIIITDHLAELAEERGWNSKQNMEKHSDYMKLLRNYFGYIPVDVQQQNAAQESVNNFKANKSAPSFEGFGESKLTARKANVILGLYSPFLNEESSYGGYDIKRLQDNYRSLSVIRQRGGESSVNIGLYFNGKTNYFKELPSPKEMTDDMYNRIINQRNAEKFSSTV